MTNSVWYHLINLLIIATVMVVAPTCFYNSTAKRSPDLSAVPDETLPSTKTASLANRDLRLANLYRQQDVTETSTGKSSSGKGSREEPCIPLYPTPSPTKGKGKGSAKATSASAKGGKGKGYRELYRSTDGGKGSTTTVPSHFCSDAPSNSPTFTTERVEFTFEDETIRLDGVGGLGAEEIASFENAMETFYTAQYNAGRRRLIFEGFIRDFFIDVVVTGQEVTGIGNFVRYRLLLNFLAREGAVDRGTARDLIREPLSTTTGQEELVLILQAASEYFGLVTGVNQVTVDPNCLPLRVTQSVYPSPNAVGGDLEFAVNTANDETIITFTKDFTFSALSTFGYVRLGLPQDLALRPDMTQSDHPTYDASATYIPGFKCQDNLGEYINLWVKWEDNSFGTSFWVIDRQSVSIPVGSTCKYPIESTTQASPPYCV